MILWSPYEQFSQLNFSCPKCSKTIQVPLSPIEWTYTSNRQPRLIHCLNTNILLISRVYQCSNEHVILGHHPDLVNHVRESGMECSIPFLLWHQTGFSITLTEHIEQFIASVVSLQECESMLVHNRLQRLYFQNRKRAEIASYHGNSLSAQHSIHEIIGISLLKQSPS